MIVHRMIVEAVGVDECAHPIGYCGCADAQHRGDAGSEGIVFVLASHGRAES
jgi:hypothetical protein